jgi:hypothetical protein
LRRQGDLRIARRQHRIRRTPEADEERVARRLEYLAAVLGRRLAHHVVVRRNRLLHRGPVIEPEQTRAFDVGEKKGAEVRCDGGHDPCPRTTLTTAANRRQGKGGVSQRRPLWAAPQFPLLGHPGEQAES